MKKVIIEERKKQAKELENIPFATFINPFTSFLFRMSCK